jgi:hypothetical protein
MYLQEIVIVTIIVKHKMRHGRGFQGTRRQPLMVLNRGQQPLNEVPDRWATDQLWKLCYAVISRPVSHEASLPVSHIPNNEYNVNNKCALHIIMTSMLLALDQVAALSAHEIAIFGLEIENGEP